MMVLKFAACVVRCAEYCDITLRRESILPAEGVRASG
jgi:hypothetical protein